MGAWRLVAPLWLVAGAHAETMSFTRSGYRYPQGTRGVLQGNPPRFAPDPFGNLQQVTTNGVTHYIVRQQGAINEDSLSVLAKLGVRYDTFFTDPRSDWRIVFGAFAAVPIYYRVTNTAFPDSVWTRFGPRGFDLSGELVVGRRVFGDLSLLVRVEGGYRFRPQTKTDPTTGGFVPDVKVRYLRAAVGGSWVF
ncbi:MAG: hypothetical protein D6771_09230 [Zetaproteobacteria bacterium]|nr:MAG: hypothetical protein D6771_09230 [Zetaproteobacteria bacterium]